MSAWLPIVMLVTVVACRDREVSKTARKSPLETGIARDLTARFGTPATVRCDSADPPRCEASVGESKLPIAVESVNAEWSWHVDGLVIESKTVVDLVLADLATLEVKDTVTCGPPLVVVRPGERIACTLSGGGAAFVSVAADGSTSLELALDRAAATARSEALTPERDQQMTEQSRALAVLEWESDGEDAVVDGGVGDGGATDAGGVQSLQ